MGAKEMKRMSMMRKKMVVVLLITLIGSIAIANAASGLPSCPPKQCCCAPTQAPMDIMAHEGPLGIMDHGRMAEMGIPHGCSPTDPEPCCNLESDFQPNELAISTGSNSNQYRHQTAHLTADIHIATPLVQTRITEYREFGWPKIPKVPIFLQTLSILC